MCCALLIVTFNYFLCVHKEEGQEPQRNYKNLISNLVQVCKLNISYNLLGCEFEKKKHLLNNFHCRSYWVSDVINFLTIGVLHRAGVHSQACPWSPLFLCLSLLRLNFCHTLRNFSLLFLVVSTFFRSDTLFGMTYIFIGKTEEF